MSYTKYSTLVSGFNTHALVISALTGSTPEEQLKLFADLEKFMAEHYVQIRRPGVLKPATIAKLAAKHGIVRGLSAEAASWDQSGKGRHDFKKLQVAA
jgi:hypothetical protein